MHCFDSSEVCSTCAAFLCCPSCSTLACCSLLQRLFSSSPQFVPHHASSQLLCCYPLHQAVLQQIWLGVQPQTSLYCLCRYCAVGNHGNINIQVLEDVWSFACWHHPLALQHCVWVQMTHWCGMRCAGTYWWLDKSHNVCVLPQSVLSLMPCSAHNARHVHM